MRKLLLQAAKKMKNQRHRKWWQRTVRAMGIVVVFCTTYALILPAITMEQEPTCGMEVHAHTESCYTQQAVTAFDCGIADGATVVHSHDALCYDAQGKLICALPEIKEHTHGDGCYTHADSCYETVEVICELEEREAHTHTEDCYTEKETFCDATAVEGHEHEPSCYPRQLSCTAEEVKLHTHEQTCYDTEGKLICQLPVVVEHIHTAECMTETMQDVLSCGMEVHTHDESCYPAEEEQLTGEYICGSGEHTHVEGCYDEAGTCICSIPEHKHELACIVEGLDMTADVEDETQWKQSFASVTLTDYWPADVLAVAQTQLDYKESTKNVILTDGQLKGYTRYGAWFGTPYGDWDTMFTAFCLNYAGVENFPVNIDHDQWIGELKAVQRYLTPDVYVPKPGDLVFMDWDQKAVQTEQLPVDADFAGIVAELIPPAEDVPAKIKVIAGDSADQVRYVTYEMDDPVIVGYGILPEAPEGKYGCGMKAHAHIWMCYGEDGTLTCQQPEHTHEESCSIRVLNFDDGSMRVELKIGTFAGIPEDLGMNILPVTRETNTDAYGAMIAAVGETMTENTAYVDSAVFYQIELLSGGAVYELPADGKISVQVTLTRPPFIPEDVAGSAGLRTFTLVEESTAVDAEKTDAELAATPMLMMGLAEDDLRTETLASTSTANYRAFETPADSTGNTENGTQVLSFDAMTFGIALTAEAEAADYWQRITSAADLTSDGIYMIVSAEGNYALKGSTGSSNGTKVNVEMVKGNPGYYVITDNSGNKVTGTDLQWNFSGSGNTRTIQNVKVSTYVNLSANTGQNTTNTAPSITYLSTEEAFRFSQSVRSGRQTTTYYLTNSGSTSFVRGTSANYTSSMLIFKLVNTTLTEPADVVSKPAIGSDGETPEKPDYPDYVNVSTSRTGEASYQVGDSAVEGSYYSDPATSKLEEHFTGEAEENGMVLSDKSVIYGDDDYNAFSAYDPNTFGVTLSALGQEFITGSQENVKIPVDVMFILDISGSMNEEKAYNSDDSRSKAMVEAVNTSIAEIMKRNENNRVGAVLYSSGTGSLLELGRYTEANGQYLEMRPGSWSASSGTYSGSFIYPNDTLFKDGQQYQNNDVYAYQFAGTYTQAGIALGAEKLMAVQETTCDVTIFKGTEQETTVKVRRQPVIILLSDGEPTHCTSNYKDVLSGPHYGDGQASNNQYRGVYGYYTILSANYYKRMVGIHYNQPAQFYTVGMGIGATGANPASSSDDAYYKRAVLDPTVNRVNEAASSSTQNRENTSLQMQKLLNNVYTDGDYINVTVGSQGWMPSWIGQVHRAVPVLDNPYVGDYSYATQAFFGDYDAKTLAATFGQILDASEAVSPYGFVLRSRTSLEMEDPVGEGMEVKGAPVLRYGGINYGATSTVISQDGKTVTYVYNHFYEATDGSGHTADLSKVTVKVVTDDNGLQTVYMDVPDYILPAYAPYMKDFSTTGEPPFYYESLPIRLIYQVGLNEEAQTALADIHDYGGEVVYYTNRYEDTIANAYLLPTNENPYYKLEGDHTSDHSVSKSENTTGTDADSFECHHHKVDHVENGVTVQVPSITQELGNNGKLTFSSERKVIDIPVEKRWHDAVTAVEMIPVEIELYSVVGDAVTRVKTLVLNQENNWQGVFERLPLLENDGYYALKENVPDGFAAIYSGTVIKITIDDKLVQAVQIQGQNPIDEELVVVSNSEAYKLPQTGGIGTHYHTFSGLLILAGACVYCASHFGRKRQKGGAGREH